MPLSFLLLVAKCDSIWIIIVFVRMTYPDLVWDHVTEPKNTMTYGMKPHTHSWKFEKLYFIWQNIKLLPRNCVSKFILDMFTFSLWYHTWYNVSYPLISVFFITLEWMAFVYQERLSSFNFSYPGIIHFRIILHFV